MGCGTPAVPLEQLLGPSFRALMCKDCNPPLLFFLVLATPLMGETAKVYVCILLHILIFFISYLHGSGWEGALTWMQVTLSNKCSNLCHICQSLLETGLLLYNNQNNYCHSKTKLYFVIIQWLVYVSGNINGILFFSGTRYPVAWWVLKIMFTVRGMSF